MPKYVIEREIPGAGKLTAEQLKGISQTSCGVLSNMGPQIQWVKQLCKTADKIYCDDILARMRLWFVSMPSKAGFRQIL